MSNYDNMIEAACNISLETVWIYAMKTEDFDLLGDEDSNFVGVRMV
jgi:hypothetical protein